MLFDGWFKHDLFATQSSDLQGVVSSLGCKGLGFWWAVVERLYQCGGSIGTSDMRILSAWCDLSVKDAGCMLDEFVELGLLDLEDGVYTNERARAAANARQELLSKCRSAGSLGGKAKANRNKIANAKADARANATCKEVASAKQALEQKFDERSSERLRAKEVEEELEQEREKNIPPLSDESRPPLTPAAPGRAPQAGTDKASSARSKAKPESVEEVQAYADSLEGYRRHVDAQSWWNFYESNGWKVGRNAMKDWKAAVRTWAQRDDAPYEAGRSMRFPENKQHRVETPVDELLKEGF